MSNLVFPLGTATGRVVSREVYTSSRINESASGKEYRSTWWSTPRYRYKVAFDSLLGASGSRQDFQALAGFLVRHFGMLDSFLFTDPEDNTVTAHPFGTGDASTTKFQLQRSLVAGAAIFWPSFVDGYEPCTDLNGAPQIYVNGVLKTVTTDYTISSTGLVTFVAAPAAAAALTWTGSYYRRCRIASPLQMERLGASFYAVPTLDLVSVL